MDNADLQDSKARQEKLVWQHTLLDLPRRNGLGTGKSLIQPDYKENFMRAEPLSSERVPFLHEPCQKFSVR